MAKDAQVVAHVEKPIRHALEELAREDGRTLSAYIERLLLMHLEKKRRLPAKPSKVKIRP
jgi:hypothetical protein